MTVVRFDPMREMDRLSRRFNKLFRQLDGGVRVERGNFVPRVDVAEDDQHVYIHAEVPGVAKDNIDVSVTDERMLVIKGNKRHEQKSANENTIRVERSYGDFVRSFALPDNINTDGINAKFDNGVLNITLPKVEPVKPKEVSIEIG